MNKQMKINVLDHGFVRLVEHYGHGDIDIPEAGIIEAARQSTQGSFRGWEEDAKLLEYLYKHKHNTPFEFAGMIIEIRAPIFVFREWHRHRTQSYNEMSARYAPLPNTNYTPSVERCMLVGASKQGAAVKGSQELTHERVLDWLQMLSEVYDLTEAVYQAGLARGIPKEIARCPVPVGRYSQMRAHANLRNWLAFLTLRMSPEAQWEIRQYANAVGVIIKECFPQTWKLFNV